METLQSAACGGVVKKLVIMTSLGVSILASDALAIDLAIKGTASESLAASNNYFLSSNPSGYTAQSTTTGALNALARTLTTDYSLNAFGSYFKYFGPGAVDTFPVWGTPANANFGIVHTEQLTTYNVGISWTRADTAQTQFAQTGLHTATARGSISSYTANAGVAHDLSRIDALTWNTIASTTSFSDSTQFPSRDLTTTLAWNHVLSPTTTMSTFVSFDWFSVDDPQESQRLFWKSMFGITSSLSPRLNFNAHFGWGFANSYQNAPGTLPTGVPPGAFVPQVGAGNSFLGDMSLTYRLLKTTAISLTAAQSIVPIFNGQLQKSEQIGLTLTHGINRLSNLTLSAAFSYVPAAPASSTIGLGQSSPSKFFSISANYGYQLAQHWHTNLSYTYNQRNDSTGTVGASTVLATLVYDFTLLGTSNAINKAQAERAKARAQQSIGYIFPGFH